MSKVNVGYNGLIDRQAKIKIQEALSRTMISDTFDDPKWQPGMPIVGTMVFASQDEIPDSEVIIDSDKIAYAAAVTANDKITIIAKKLGLT